MSILRRLLPSLLLPVLGAGLAGCAVVNDDSTQSNDALTGAPPPWTTELEVLNDYGKVLKYNSDHLERGTFRSDHDKASSTRQGSAVDIAYALARAPNEKGAIVVVNGRTESFSHYGELVYDLNRRGYSLYLLDHRGQGHSSRLLDYATVGDAEYEKGHVDDFQDYVDDFGKFIRTVVLPDRRGKAAPLFNLSHSMGGAITTLYEEQHPGTFKAVALSSPMHGIQAKELTVLIGRAGDLLSPTSYVTGTGPLDLHALYDNNKLTASRARYAAKYDVWTKQVDTRIGGATYRWAIQSVDSSKRIRAGAGEVRSPLLILQAQYDELADPNAQREVCSAVNRAGKTSCTLEVLGGTRPDGQIEVGAHHESLIEVDAVRHRALDRILAFLDANSR